MNDLTSDFVLKWLCCGECSEYVVHELLECGEFEEYVSDVTVLNLKNVQVSGLFT